MSKDNSMHLLIFGLGYVGQALADDLISKNTSSQKWKVTATTRNPSQIDLQENAIRRVFFDGTTPLNKNDLAGVTHILSTIPPHELADPVLPLMTDAFKELAPLWLGYVSSTSVYGDRQGGWVDETTPTNPKGSDSVARDNTEQLWLKSGLPAHIFRMSGVYGPGRSSLDRLRNGQSHRIVKPGQVFGRIHVKDVCQILEASMNNPQPSSIYNMTDDEPAPPQDLVVFAANLLGIEPPPEQHWEEIKDQVHPMVRFFYDENRRISNVITKEKLNITLHYPSYREGIMAMWEEEKSKG